MKKNSFSIYSIWKKYKIFLCLNLAIILVLFLSTDLARAGSIGGNSVSEAPQQVTVKGIVTDKNTGEALPGVNVVVRGTTIGTVTDVAGSYTLVVPTTSGTLVFSFIGYATQEVAIAGRTILDVILLSDIAQLNEVVVVGYGTQLKKDVTGSVSTISAGRLLDKPAFNVAQAVGGKIAGVKIVERTGAPGGNPMIRVRGTNSINSGNDPLFVVDGIVGVANALTILSPNEIQSMDVLKDASATAIYGARGSNGVIIITTKRGIAGKPQVEYNSYVTRGIMNRHTPAMDAEQFMYVSTQAWKNISKYAPVPNWLACYDASLLPAGYAGKTYSDLGYLFEQTTLGGYSIPLLGRDGNYYKPRFSTNWEDETFKAFTSTNQEISIRGGTDRAKFGAFFNYARENGLLLNSYFNRFSGKVNGDIKINEWLSVSTNLGINKNTNRTNDVSMFSGGMARAVTESYPILPVKFPNDPAIYGTYADTFGDNQDYPIGEVDCQSPVHVSDGVKTYTDRTQATGDVTLNFKITSDLTLKSNLSIDANFSKYKNYQSIEVSRGSQGSANLNTSNSFYWQNENYLNYNKTFGDHSITGLLGLSWSRNTYENFNGANDHFFDDFYMWHNIGVGAATRPVPSSSDGQNSLNSYFARVNYSYKGKYLATLTGRIDGSSRFGANTKYGFFPSGSLAWRMSEEDFLKSVDAISNLKLRVSVGQTGNQEIGNYVTQTFIGSGNVVIGNSVLTGLWPSSVGNSDLKWEKTTQYDGGIDLGLFKDRISLSADYYYKLTTDMLLSVPLPRSTTTGSVRKNFGKVENKGFEVTLGTTNIKSENFNWYTDLVWSTNKNTIIELGPTGADIFTNSWVAGNNNVLRVGSPIGSFFGLQRLGTYSTEEAVQAARYGFVPGDVKYFDKNGDGVINYVSDGDVLGNPFPKWDMSINNTFNYKNFDLNIDIRFSYGAKKSNRTLATSEDRQLVSNGYTSILDAWRPDHQNTMIGQVRPGMGGAYYQMFPDTRWIEDASFIRGDGATIGYTLPKIGGISKLRIYANTKNFFVITKYSGYDPEGSDNDNMNDSLNPGIDFFMYPRPTTFTFGVNLTF
jgi:TonB-dependent starch-binding outer membrane protein SusC